MSKTPLFTNKQTVPSLLQFAKKHFIFTYKIFA